MSPEIYKDEYSIEILEKSLNLALIVVFNFIFCIVCTLCVCYNT